MEAGYLRGDLQFDHMLESVGGAGGNGQLAEGLDTVNELPGGYDKPERKSPPAEQGRNRQASPNGLLSAGCAGELRTVFPGSPDKVGPSQMRRANINGTVAAANRTLLLM